MYINASWSMNFSTKNRFNLIYQFIELILGILKRMKGLIHLFKAFTGSEPYTHNMTKNSKTLLSIIFKHLCPEGLSVEAVWWPIVNCVNKQSGTVNISEFFFAMCLSRISSTWVEYWWFTWIWDDSVFTIRSRGNSLHSQFSVYTMRNKTK